LALPGLTQSIAKWLSDPAARAQGAKNRPTAALGFRDCIAVMHAGWQDEVASELRRIEGLEDWADPMAPPERPAGELALHLAVAAHVLDYDDTAFGGHPSAVLVPALLAEVAANPVDGRRLLDAYVAGYETWAELSAREPDSVHAKGWHPSAVYGPLAVAAAVSALRGYNDERALNAISLAASMSGGLVAQFGTGAKPWQLGRAAASGIQATDLADAGIRGARDVLEHPLGFLMAISPSGRAQTERTSELGMHIARNGLNIKRYPVCYAMHRILDGVVGIMHGEQIEPAAVASVEVEIGEAQAAILRHKRPDTVPEAKFSLEFGVASLILRGRLGLAELQLSFIRSDDLRNIASRVRTQALAGRHEIEPSLARADRVTIHLSDGRTMVSEWIELPIGHARNPAPEEMILEKVRNCLSAGPRPHRAADIAQKLNALEQLTSTSLLISPTDGAAIAR
jgi:2-methylcitrate dehydratase PrpD